MDIIGFNMAKLNLIEFAEDGTLVMRWKKDDGGWHRASCPPDFDLDHLLDLVDAHLISMGSSAANSQGGKSRALLKTALTLADELKGPPPNVRTETITIPNKGN